MRALVLVILALALTACSGDRPLHDMRSGTGGPDDFSASPTKPLTMPESFDLPTPTPGGANLTDVDPNADVIAALGGNAGAQRAGGIPSGDAALVAQASRFGTTADIRATLASEDSAFRAGAKRFGLFAAFRENRYFNAYAGQALDAYAELERFRNAGIATPSAPPGN